MRASQHLSASAAPGDYVIVYAGVAIEAVSREEAEEQIRFLRELEEQFPSEEFPVGDA